MKKRDSQDEHKETIWVMSYPKAGTHYIAHLLRHNFNVNTKFGGHLLPSCRLSHWRSVKPKTVYIQRSMEEATASNASTAAKPLSPELFRSTTWGQLWDEEYFDIARREINWPLWLPKTYRFTTTPETYWYKSVEEWTEYAKTDPLFYIVQYEELKNPENFQETMSGIAEWLGSNKTEFEDITKKVDKSPFRDGGFESDYHDYEHLDT